MLLKNQSIFIVLLAVAFLLQGCLPKMVSVPVDMKYMGGQYTAKGKILVLPPRNATQRGQLTLDSEGTGKLLESMLVKQINEIGKFSAITTKNSSFDNLEVSTLKSLIQEGESLGVDFVLQTVLGDFNDSPTGFGSDGATLADAKLYSIADKEKIWELTDPLGVIGSNNGNCDKLFERIAEEIAKSISMK